MRNYCFLRELRKKSQIRQDDSRKRILLIGCFPCRECPQTPESAVDMIALVDLSEDEPAKQGIPFKYEIWDGNSNALCSAIWY